MTKKDGGCGLITSGILYTRRFERASPDPGGPMESRTLLSSALEIMKRTPFQRRRESPMPAEKDHQAAMLL
jgi:hypothetical protein